MKRLAFAALLCVAPSAVLAADAEPPPADVSKAIDAGAGWLRARYKDGFADRNVHDTGELVVLTLAHCGANLSDPVFKQGLAQLESFEPRFTYRTSLQAMALSEVNPRLYRKTLARCAQWLVDTQCAEGEWGYPGTPTGDGRLPEGLKVAPPPEPEAPEEPAGRDAGMGAGKGAGRPAGGDRLVIQRRTTAYAGAGPKGDFSNTQFAILGLRACRDAGIDVPIETWKAALGYLRKYQRPDGGFGYVMTGVQDESAYASLTCAGVCSAMICLAATGVKDPKTDPLVKRALGWLAKRHEIGANTGIDESSVIGPSDWQCYHLYSLERAGRVLGATDVGGKPWYGPGATWLLGKQQGDGSWRDTYRQDPAPSYLSVSDTCFALLFLTRATRPLTGK